jgi:DNA-binding PadR family transcriptional regulator
MPDIAVWIAGGTGPDDEPADSPRGSRGRGRHKGPGSHRRHGRHGRRARRGDARLAILLLLAEEPRNGYGLMQEIEERSGGVWRPSPGSIYPALSQLEDEGLIEPTGEGRKAFTLSREGREYVEANRERMGTPWKTMAGGASGELGRLRESGQALAMAAAQVARTGNPAQIEAATEVMDQARRSLYRLLAGEEPEGSDA